MYFNQLITYNREKRENLGHWVTGIKNFDIFFHVGIGYYKSCVYVCIYTYIHICIHMHTYYISYHDIYKLWNMKWLHLLFLGRRTHWPCSVSHFLLSNKCHVLHWGQVSIGLGNGLAALYQICLQCTKRCAYMARTVGTGHPRCHLYK